LAVLVVIAFYPSCQSQRDQSESILNQNVILMWGPPRFTLCHARVFALWPSRLHSSGR